MIVMALHKSFSRENLPPQIDQFTGNAINKVNTHGPAALKTPSHAAIQHGQLPRDPEGPLEDRSTRWIHGFGGQLRSISFQEKPVLVAESQRMDGKKFLESTNTQL